MKLTVNAEQLDLRFMSMANEETQPPKKVFGSEADEQKTDDNGYPLFAARNLQALRLNEDGSPSGTENGVTVSLRETAPLVFGQVYKLTGDVTVNHWITNSKQLGVSIIADSVEPVSGSAS